MSQQQPRRDPIKYGDVFPVAGQLATKPITPEDASMLQAAETQVLGQTQKGGPAAVMQAAATRNQRAGLGDADAVEAVSVAEADVAGARIIVESVAGQVVGEYAEATPAGGGGVQSKITIGEAMEASGHAAGKKAVEHSDAAAIQAAECRATGSSVISPGGLAATAQSAAAYNDDQIGDEGKIKLGDVLAEATTKLASDKVATREDAEGIISAELRNDPNITTHPGGVAASVAAAARINERDANKT